MSIVPKGHRRPSPSHTITREAVRLVGLVRTVQQLDQHLAQFAARFRALLQSLSEIGKAMRRDSPGPQARLGTHPRVTIREHVEWLIREVAILEHAPHEMQGAVRDLADALAKVTPLVSSTRALADDLEALRAFNRDARFVLDKIEYLTTLLNAISTANVTLTRVLPTLLAEARIEAVVQDRIRRAIKPLAAASITPDPAIRRVQKALAKLAIELLRSNPALTQKQFDALVPTPVLSTRGRRQAFTPALIQDAYLALRGAQPMWKHDAVVDALATRLHVSERTIDTLLARARRRN